MPIPAITLEVLPAAYGDCLLIQCPVGKRTWRMLVDTGPDDSLLEGEKLAPQCLSQELSLCFGFRDTGVRQGLYIRPCDQASDD